MQGDAHVVALFFADIIWLTKALEVTILGNIELWNTKWSMSIKILFIEYIRMILNMPERNPNRHWVHRYDTDTLMYCIYISYHISILSLVYYSYYSVASVNPICVESAFCCFRTSLCSVSPVRRARVAPMAAFTAAWLSRCLLIVLNPEGS